jgi:hypothetical protein
MHHCCTRTLTTCQCCVATFAHSRSRACPGDRLSQVLFRNNQVQDVCQLDRSAAPIWAQRFANNPPQDATACHHDYLVFNNTFNSGPGQTMLLFDVNNVAVVDNAFHVCDTVVDVVEKSSNSAEGYYFSSSNTVSRSHDARLCDK